MSQQISPMQLISFDKNKNLQVNQEAVKWLNSVNQDKHIGIVTVVGKYRTGKSYILNRVLLNQNKGFTVGPSINACTKGLWIWPQLIQSDVDPTLQYLVMDTQGLDSLEQGQKNDTKIFLMAMLLSSYFIYNSISSIDQKAIQNLSLIVNLSKLLQKGSQKDMQTIINCFPSFLWLLRDFSLKLNDSKGNKITSKEYLQNALRLQDQDNKTSQLAKRKNGVRKQLVNFFKQRDCFTLVRPVQDQKILQDLSKAKDSQLRPLFVQLIKELQNKISHSIKKKTFKGKPCSPSMFIQLCQYFCSSINNGGLPQIQSNWEMVCKAEAARIQKKCYSQFDHLLQYYNRQNPQKLNMKEMEHKIKEKIQSTLKYFQKHTIGNKIQKKKQMKIKLQEQYQKISATLSHSKTRKLEQDIGEMSSQIDTQINLNYFQSIYQISEQYDHILQKEGNISSAQTLCFIYKKCYESFKSNIHTFWGSNSQNQRHQQNLLTQKLSFYQNSLNRIQSEHNKRNEQTQLRQRQLRQAIFQLQIKKRNADEELQNARKELMNMQLQKEDVKAKIYS